MKVTITLKDGRTVTGEVPEHRLAETLASIEAAPTVASVTTEAGS